MRLKFKRLVLLCVALAVLCVVTFTGLSRVHQETDPDLALRFNPMNTHVKTFLLASGLSGPDNLEQLHTLKETGLSAVRYSPINALAFGLLGEVYFGEGDEQTAEALFDTALSLSKTEANALLRTLATAVNQGEVDAAMDKLDILFRRWPDRITSFAPIIPVLMRSPEGYRAGLETLRTRPPWRKQFLWFLNRSPRNVGLAYRLQLDLGAGEDAWRHNEIGQTLWALLRRKHTDLAYRLFLLTLSDKDRAHSGFVFNGRFALEPSGRPFDWSLTSDAGVSISRMVDDQSGPVLMVRFLGKPVKTIRAGQLLFLPAGRYRLTVDLDADNLKAPKGLFVRISCDALSESGIRLNIPAGSYRDKTLTGEFKARNDRCSFYRLGFATDLIVESFRYGYSGTLYIRGVTLRRIAA